jgi:hypothetical protein
MNTSLCEILHYVKYLNSKCIKLYLYKYDQ